MTEKVKVPRWFDEWYKSFNSDTVRLHYLNRVGYDTHRFLDGDNLIYAGKHDYVIRNKFKLNRAILDGYEVEEEYIEIDPFEAYEYFYKGKDIYSDYKDKSNYNKTNISEFEPRNIKENNIKFYIKKENEQWLTTQQL